MQYELCYHQSVERSKVKVEDWKAPDSAEPSRVLSARLYMGSIRGGPTRGDIISDRGGEDSRSGRISPVVVDLSSIRRGREVDHGSATLMVFSQVR